MSRAYRSFTRGKELWHLTFSVRLFQLLGAEMHIFIKAEGFYPFGSAQNATFWKKLRFGPRQKTRSECANIMDRRRSINQNAHARLNYTVGLDGQLWKYPDKNSSVLMPEVDSHASHFISLLSLCTKLTLTPPISSIIKIQTQKHNLKINQTTTIKAKKFLLS